MRFTFPMILLAVLLFGCNIATDDRIDTSLIGGVVTLTSPFNDRVLYRYGIERGPG